MECAVLDFAACLPRARFTDSVHEDKELANLSIKRLEIGWECFELEIVVIWSIFWQLVQPPNRSKLANAHVFRGQEDTKNRSVYENLRDKLLVQLICLVLCLLSVFGVPAMLDSCEVIFFKLFQ